MFQIPPPPPKLYLKAQLHLEDLLHLLLHPQRELPVGVCPPALTSSSLHDKKCKIDLWPLLKCPRARPEPEEPGR